MGADLEPATAEARRFRCLVGGMAFVSLLLIAPSTRLWFQHPLTLTAHEFDLFLGLFAGASPHARTLIVGAGRVLHLAALLLIGVLYLKAVALARSPGLLSPRRLFGISAGFSLLYAIALPWVSPDVFYYVGLGWLESHYGLDPYTHFIGQVGAPGDEMFRNVHPALALRPGTYGPVFQSLATGLMFISGGSIKAALVLLKLFGLALQAIAGLLVWELAEPENKVVATFAFVCSPLVLFCALTGAHNDQLMVVFLLLSLLLVRRNLWVLAGLSLALGTGVKFAPLLLVPLFLLEALHSRDAARPRLRLRIVPPLAFLGGFALGVAAFCLPYPSSLTSMQNALLRGSGAWRNSVFHLTVLVDYFIVPCPFSGARIVLGGLFALGAVGVAAVFLRDRRRAIPGTLERCAIALFALYFLLLNTSNHEWYMTWLLAFAFVGAGPEAERLGLRLSAFFLPLVIFTIGAAPILLLGANVSIYLLLVGACLPFLRSLLEGRNGPGRPAPAQTWRASSPDGGTAGQRTAQENGNGPRDDRNDPESPGTSHANR